MLSQHDRFRQLFHRLKRGGIGNDKFRDDYPETLRVMGRG